MSLDLAWDDTTKNLSGTVESDDDATLTRSTGSPSTFVLKYRLHIALDSAVYSKSEVEVHLPMVLGNYRDGTSVTLQPTNIGIGQNPDAATPDVPFYYQVEGDDCVIRNARDLNQALSVSIEVAFTVDPVKIRDTSTATVTATGSFPDDTGTIQTVSAPRPLTYKTDTQTILDDFYFPANQTKSIFEWGSTMPEPAGGYPLDTLHYRYVMYTAIAYAPDTGYNQPYTLKVQLDSAATGGTLIHASSSGMTYDPSSKSLTRNVTEDETRNVSYLSKSKKYYKFAVAYPRNEGDPDTLSYPATFTCTVTPADGEDTPTSITDTCTYTWKDYHFDYTKVGEKFTLSKGGTTGRADGYEKALSLLDQGIDADNLLYTVTGKGMYYPKTGDPQYPDTDDSKRIGMTLVDDLMYLHNSGAATGDMVRLSPDDCSLDNVSVALANTITDRISGSKITVRDFDAQYPDIKLSVSYKTKEGGDAWGTPTEYTFNHKNYVNDIPIPEGAYAVKIDLPAVFQDSIEVELKVNYSLKHDSPAYASLRNLNDPAQSVLVLNNFCGLIPSVSSGAALDTTLTDANYGGDSKNLGLPQYDLDAYGKYLLRANKAYDLKSLAGDAVFGEFATGSTDSVNGTAYTEYQMDAVSGYRSSSSLTQEQYDQLVEKGLPSASLDNVVFYDLLPRGAYLATDSARAPSVGRMTGSSSTAPCDAQVSVIDNYRGTGRQMVKIEVDSGLAPGKNVQQSLRCYQAKDSYVSVSGKVSGFTVKLWMAVPFSEAGLVNGAKNNAAFQKAEGGLVGGYSDRSRDDMRFPDTGESPVLEDVRDAHGASAFYNLAEKPEGPDVNLLNTMYAADTVTLPHSISYGDGLTNFVKPDTFVDDALFSQSASVLIGQPYIFRMSLISGTKLISNAILFDNFGKASVGGKHSTWTGTFESIDLSNATIRGIAPVVYYTTQEDAPYFTADDTRMRAVPAAWSTVKPADPADIKGIAVDLSHAADGSEYAIPLQQAIGVYVTMRAPSTLPSPDAEEYNQAAYYAKVDGAAHNPEDSALSAPAVTTRLIEPKLVKANAPDFDTWVKAGDTITYTLSYTNEATETHPLVLEDAAPAGTTLAPAGTGGLAGNPTLEVNGSPVANAATVEPGAGSITWHANVPTGQTATATFQVVVRADAKGQIENQGDAAIRDAATSTDAPFSSNTVKNRILPVLKKAVTGGTQGADQHAYPGDVLTYELRYTNDTSQDQKVSIGDSAPTGTTLANSTGNPTINVAGTASTAGSTVTWDIPVLQPGKEAVVTFQVVVDDDAVAGSTIANTGTVVVDDGSVTVDSNEVTTSVDPRPAVTKSVAGGTAGGGRAYPGDVLTYALGYTNESASAQKVVLRDAAPAGTHFVPVEGGGLAGAPTAALDGAEVAGAAAPDGGGIAWSFDSVAAGSSVETTFQVVVDEVAAGTDVSNVGSLFVNDSTTEIETNEVTTPVDPKPVPTKSVTSNNGASDRAFPGNTLTYTIKYTNASRIAQDVVLRDAAPVGTRLAPVEGGGLAGAPTATLDGAPVAGAAAPDGDGLAWAFDSVGAGSTVTATFQVVVDEAAAGTDVANTGALFLNGGTAEVKTNEVTTPVDPKPVVSKSVEGGTAGGGRAYPGDVLTYALGYTNESASAQKVVLRDAAPAGTHFVATEGGGLAGAPTATLDSVPVANAAAPDGGGIAWTFDSVAAGSTITATFQVVVDKAAAGTDVANVGGLFLNGGTTEVKTNEVTTPVDPKPVVSKSVEGGTAGGGRAYPGDVLTYTLGYTNESASAQKVVLRDAAPAGTHLIAAEGGGLAGAPSATLDGAEVAGAAAPDGGGIAWTFDSVAAGSSVEVTFQVVVNDAATGTDVANVGALFVNDGTTKIETNEVTTPVDPKPAVIKSVAGGTATVGRAYPGDVLTYAMSYTNESKIAQDVVLRDAAPAGTRLVAAEGGRLTGAPSATLDGAEVAGAAAPDGDGIVWTFAAVAAGSTVTATFHVVVDDSAAGTDVSNTGGLFLNGGTTEVKTNEVTTPVDPKPKPDPDPDPPTDPDPPDDPNIPDDPTPPDNPKPDPEPEPTPPTDGGQTPELNPETKPLDTTKATPKASQSDQPRTGDLPPFVFAGLAGIAAIALPTAILAARRSKRTQR